MKRLIIIAEVLLLGGCVADKRPDPPARRDGPPPLIAPAPPPMDAYYAALQGQRPIFLAALAADKTSASAVALATAPAAPAGALPALPNLRSFVIVNGCNAGAEQCISPSLPAAAADKQQQRDEDAPDGDRPALDGQTCADNRPDVDKMTSPEERTDASAPQVKLRILPPAGR